MSSSDDLSRLSHPEPPKTGGESDELPRERRGPLAFMANNSVAANLLMLVLIVGGLLLLPSIKQEVFPEFELDLVLVNIPYPGASPAEVEQGVILAAEEAIRDVDGIKEVRSTAAEGTAVIAVELLVGTDSQRALNDIKSAIDRVTSFPQDIERPVVSLATNRREVVSLVVYGDKSERELRAEAERIRDDLLDNEQISVVELAGVRPLEISIEVPRENLRRYKLTLDTIANLVRAASVELPGGGVKTRSGEILVRTAERRDFGSEFADIVVLSRPDGSEIKLGDIAEIDDGFRDTDQAAFFNGQPAAMVQVFRVGDQTPLELSRITLDYVEQHRGSMPKGVGLSVWRDQSEIYRDRLELLMNNAYIGLALVMFVLGLFLEIHLAFWVTMGIPISFIGSLLILPFFDASINMISLFAFIVTLGLVVDDAIVVGEAVYLRRTRGMNALLAAIRGVREVAIPVVFAVVTTMMAFAPMLFVTGIAGKFFRLIPIVVIAVLLISLVESLLVLPAHLAHSRGSQHGVLGFINRQQQRFSRKVEWFVEHVYVPFIARAVKNRYLTFAACLAVLIAALGLIRGGRVKFSFFPKVESDRVSASVRMPFGTPVAQTSKVARRLVVAAERVLDRLGGTQKVSRGIFAEVGSSDSGGRGPRSASLGGGGAHLAQTSVTLVPLDQRNFTSAQFTRAWREEVGEIAGVEALTFQFATGPGAGSPIDIELSHTDIHVLEVAAAELSARLREYTGVYQIDSGFSEGKEQLDLKLKPGARALGITEVELGRQLRGAFYGAEAARQQRGRDEVRAYVRLPDRERRSEHDIEDYLIFTPDGGEVPLRQAAQVKRGRSYTEIKRTDGRRVVNVTADVDDAVANANEIVADVEQRILPDILAAYPRLSYSLAGEQRSQAETLGSLRQGFLLALIGIFALLAVAFRSYVQPLIIMLVIPFGLVGAILGHVLMGYSLSLMSMMGIVALSGVVVNDSLILIVAVNEYRREGDEAFAALIKGGARRFRPILLTSLTTFFGLMPMILETSVQARFLIPMAISLGFGVLFATVITLLLVPATYQIVEDLKRVMGSVVNFVRGEAATSASPGQ